MRKRSPLYTALMAVLLLLLLAGVALLIGGMLSPATPLRPQLLLPMIARCTLHG